MKRLTPIQPTPPKKHTGGRPKALSVDDEQLLFACFAERDKLKRQLEQLTNKSLADKFGIGITGVEWRRTYYLQHKKDIDCFTTEIQVRVHDEPWRPISIK